MNAFYLINNGAAKQAFELREIKHEEPKDDEVVIDVEAFGLNFADVMARLGYYKACPPLPTVIGYDVAGRIIKAGKNVPDLKTGQRVVALTRFGGYSQQVVVNYRGVVPVSEEVDAAMATALATQYATAYYAAEVAMQIHENEHVLVQAAAGGVGTALVQLAKRKNCTVYGTAGSSAKLEYLKQQGVDFPINYRDKDFAAEIMRINKNKKIDVIFDSIGGKSVKDGLSILATGGRYALYGAAKIAGNSNKKSVLRQIRTLFGFGKYSPILFFSESQSFIGVNMLKLGDFKPEIVHHCLQRVVELYENGEIKPVVGKVFNAKQLAEAHSYLQERKSIGKIAVRW